MKNNALKDTIKWILENHEESSDVEFLHKDKDGHPRDKEGEMVKTRLSRMNKMSRIIDKMLSDDDQLPAWVQDHIAVAHENLQQVFSYMDPVEDLDSDEGDDSDDAEGPIDSDNDSEDLDDEGSDEKESDEDKEEE